MQWRTSCKMWCTFSCQRAEFEARLHTAVQTWYFTMMSPALWRSRKKQLLIFLFSFLYILSPAVEQKLQAIKCYLFVLYTSISLNFFLHYVLSDLSICSYFLLLSVSGYQVQPKKFCAGREAPGNGFVSFHVENSSQNIKLISHHSIVKTNT